MIALPVPMIVALLLGFVFVRAVISDRMPGMLAALLLTCAVQSMLVSIVHYCGISELRMIQPITAATIPALTWVAFLDSSIRAHFRRMDCIHFGVPVIMAVVVTLAPVLIDPLLAGIFAGYGSAILLALHRQGDDLANTPLGAGHVPALIWRVIAVALIISAISDALITATLNYGLPDAPGIILSVFSSLALLTIGFLALSPDIAMRRPENSGTPTAETSDTSPAQNDIPVQTIMAELEALVVERQLYLDADLTLARLARRLGYPLKQVSTAINAVTGENVSRYINKFRVDHACGELAKGETVTTAMLASGFNTKSNFNREFLRITGETPSQWLLKTRQH